MTTYVYRCDNEDCTMYGELSEVVHSMQDDALTLCPACNEHTLTRVIGSTQFLLMGDGWPSNFNKGTHHVNGKEKGMGK